MKDSKKGNTENEIMLDTTLRPFKLEVNMETSDILSKPSDIVCCGAVFQKNTKQHTTSLENGTDEDMESITRTEDNTASDCLCTDHRRSRQIYNLLKSYYDKSGNPQIPFKFQAMQPESEACMSDCSGRIGSDECYKEKESSYGSKFCAPLNDCIASTDQAIERLKEANFKLSISNSHEIESGGPNAVGDPQIQVENCCKVIRKCLQPSEDKELKGHAVEVQPVHSVLSQRPSVAQESSQRQREATQGHIYKEKETRVIPKSSHYDEINRQNVIAEIQTFLDDMKRKSSTRLKALEQDTEVQTGMTKMEFEKQRKGMEIIQKLDMKLQDLEEKHFVLPCKQGPQYCRVCKDSHTNPKFMRKRRKRLSKVTQTLNILNSNLTQNWDCHAIRNMRLGPNARFFTLSMEEEFLVEEILSQPDFADVDSEIGSMSSHVSTAFDIEGEEALRLAEIETKLEQYKEKHSDFSLSPIASVTTLESRGNCAFTRFDELKTPLNHLSPTEFTGQHKVVYQALVPLATTTAVDDYLADLRDRREFEFKYEEIDRKLRRLQTGEFPAKLSEEEMTRLIVDCKSDHELYGVQHFCAE